MYSLAVFTTAASGYADAIIDRIDLSRRIVRRFYRHDCRAVHGPDGCVLAKDLSCLNVPLTSVVLVDNSSACLSLQPSNGLLINSYRPPWRNAKESAPADRRDGDNTLLGLIPFFEALSYVADVRDILQFQKRCH
jgi:RNA polymerase II subunit A small phosphatase-like protein